MITVADAERLVLANMSTAPSIRVPLDAAFGEVLREAIAADRPFPPYNRVAMDGIAIAHAAWAAGARAFPIEGIQRAGEPPHALAQSTHALEVMTGAVLPVGCDCVIPVEQLTRDGNVATLHDGLRLEAMQNIHRLGSDCAAGTILLRAGSLLFGPQCATAAAVGHAHVAIAQRPSIAIISTGDELVDVASTPLPHQVRRSNRFAAQALLHTAGFRNNVHTQHVVDDPTALHAILQKSLQSARVLLLSGGVSEGRYDYVPDTLARLGVQPRFHKVSQKPGKPLWFGTGPDGQIVFGLPGNPVSVAVCLLRFVLPALWAHLGASLLTPSQRPHARLTEPIRFRKPMTLFQPVRIRQHPDGTRSAAPVPLNGSGDLTGLAACDGLLELAPNPDGQPAGSAHPFWAWTDPHGILMQPGSRDSVADPEDMILP
jgi:molybdopterin molybdotransferase